MSRHGPTPLTHSITRNPWSGRGESVSSSASSQTYHVIPHQYIQVERGGGYWSPAQVPTQLHRLSGPDYHSGGTLSRAVTPQSCPTEPVILPCGGRCVPLERFCHRILQVALVGGLVSGGVLTAAGLLGSPDTAVLAYIGPLTALVSGLLLAVQTSSTPRRRSHHQPARQDIPLRQLPTPSHHPTASFREESGIPWWRREDID